MRNKQEGDTFIDQSIIKEVVNIGPSISSSETVFLSSL